MTDVLNPKLFGINLMINSYHNLPFEGQISGHTFYHPIQKSQISIHIWSVRYEPRDIYFFSIYENGKHLYPKEDPRFAKAMTKYFPKQKPWTECSFESLYQLIAFLRDCNIQ